MIDFDGMFLPINLLNKIFDYFLYVYLIFYALRLVTHQSIIPGTGTFMSHVTKNPYFCFLETHLNNAG